MDGEINKVFKKVLLVFLKDNMNSCKSMLQDIERASTYDDLEDCLIEHGEDIAERLGIDLDEDCDECKSKDKEISYLEEELEVNAYLPVTLDDKFKLEAFIKNKDKFSVSDFESLLD